MPRRQRFYVQSDSGQMWHVETEDDCERMLCGVLISVDLATVRVRNARPSRSLACPDCWMKSQA